MGFYIRNLISHDGAYQEKDKKKNLLKKSNSIDKKDWELLILK